jgi:hypothetical protein
MEKCPRADLDVISLFNHFQQHVCDHTIRVVLGKYLNNDKTQHLMRACPERGTSGSAGLTCLRPRVAKLGLQRVHDFISVVDTRVSQITFVQFLISHLHDRAFAVSLETR